MNDNQEPLRLLSLGNFAAALDRYSVTKSFRWWRRSRIIVPLHPQAYYGVPGFADVWPKLGPLYNILKALFTDTEEAARVFKDDMRFICPGKISSSSSIFKKDLCCNG